HRSGEPVLARPDAAPDSRRPRSGERAEVRQLEGLTAIERRVVVVGAGVVGLACAWALRRAGASVVVLERGTVGAGVSRGNTGWVCPSFTYPLPAPGMVREGLRQLVTGGEAVVLRPSLDPAFVRWLWGFRRSCSQPRFDAGVRALLALNDRTLELF